MTPSPSPRQLRRELGLGGAILLGLGSMVGTGVFVSIGVAAGVAGPSVILAVLIGAVVALANGLSSAQLAANHPVSGGTYEYGYRYLRPWLGFSAGWLFLLAKSASAATAAQGFAGYALSALGLHSPALRTAVAVLTVLAVTAVVIGGVRRSNRANTAIVVVTLGALLVFIVSGFFRMNWGNFTPFLIAPNPASGVITGGLNGLLAASALMFVAFTGYGRIATLGEEVRDPRRIIPRAILITTLITALLYVSVAVAGIGSAGAGAMSEGVQLNAAPLEAIMQRFNLPVGAALLALGALAAMVGVLLNLILGLSRVLLAMGRRGDMPAAVARLDPSGSTPTLAVLIMGGVVAGLALIGDVRVTWSFSAFTVLIYYAVTNLAALQLRGADRLYPAWIAWAGLGACLFLAFWVDPMIWAAGLGLLAVGLGWHWVTQKQTEPRR